MSSAGRAAALRSARRWRIASGFCAVVTFTVVAGYYVPLHREAKNLRVTRESLTSEHTALQEALAHTQRQLRDSQAQQTALAGDVDARKSIDVDVKQRIQKLKDLLSVEFRRLVRAKMLTVSSAGDRVSVAVAVPVLFRRGGLAVTEAGRVLLCQLSKTIMAEHTGQIRVTGYYGKPRIEEADLAARHATPWQLSAARAASAVDALEKGCAAPTDRFLVVGYGPRAAGPLGENVALEFIFGAGD